MDDKHVVLNRDQRYPVSADSSIFVLYRYGCAILLPIAAVLPPYICLCKIRDLIDVC